MSFTLLELGDPRLRRVATPVSANQIGSAGFRERVSWMRQHLGGKGLGIAAPQIGWDARVLVVRYGEEQVRDLPPSWREELGIEPFGPHVLVNPTIEVTDEATTVFYEGCMSVPERVGLVSRPLRIRVRALDEHGEALELEAAGYLARLVLHEADHLDGVLYVDRAEPGSLAHWDTYAHAKGSGWSPSEVVAYVGARAGLSPR